MDSLIEPSSLTGLGPDTISISNVNLSLGSGAARVHILKDISLRVASGEAIGLIGPSGSGKSTLLMVMAGLERPDSGEVVVSGTPFNALDEDALARFRGRQVGIVFQSFHLIPTMTALENVAVPLELAGNPDAAARAAQELTSVGLGDRLHHYPTQLSGGEQQRVALARALAPDPAILVADEPTGNLDEATGKQIVDLLFTKHAERGMTLVLVTHDTSLAQRCDRVVRLRSGRIDGPFMTAISEPVYRSRASSLALRYALRELRSGLRGFYVFIACIALGVMAIAGVGSVAASLSEGLTREGRTLLGGDVAFSLIQREAKPEEIAFLRARGQVSVAAALRVMARSSDGQLALVELKAVDGNYPMLGQVTLEPKMPMADLFAERDGAFGAAVDSILLARLDLKLGDRITIGNAAFQIRSVVVAEPDKLAGNVGLGPARSGQRGEPARHRIAAARQPGALDLPREAAEQCGRRSRRDPVDRQRAERPAGGRLVDPQQQQRVAAARTNHQPLHPVPDAGRPRRASGRRRRRRQRGQEPYRSPPRRHRLVQGAGRHRPRRLHDLPDAGDPARRGRLADRAGRRRGVAVRHRRRVRQAAAAAGDPCPASRRTGAVVRLWPAHRARLRIMAARPGARRAGRGAVSRGGRA